MIKKINKIKNLGLFKDYRDAGISGFEFKRYNLIYGHNGSGKTTLSRLFTCIENRSFDDFPDLKYDITLGDGQSYKQGMKCDQQIRVFNGDYVKNNVASLSDSQEVSSSIFILGEENIVITNAIKEDKADLAEISKSMNAEAQEHKKKKDAEKETFATVAKSIGSSRGGRTERQYRQPDAKKDFDAFEAANKLNRAQILDGAELSKRQGILRQDTKDDIPRIAIDINLSALHESVKEICEKSVVIEAIPKIVAEQDSDLVEWIEKGLTFHGLDSKKCEFCDSDIPYNRIQELFGHFNTADQDLKEMIRQECEKIENVFKDISDKVLPSKGDFYSDLREDFEGKAKSYNNKKKEYLAELSSLGKALEKKRVKTTEKMSIPELESDKEGDKESSKVSNEFQSALNSVNDLIKKHNERTRGLGSKKEETEDSIKKHHLSKIRDEVMAHRKEIEDCEAKISGYEDSIKQLEGKITTNESKISSTYRACDLINKNLKSFLGRDEIIFEVVPEEEGGGYYIKRDGKIAKNLSESEKTAIAFVYFIVGLEDRDFDIGNGIIVVDDPISSLDSNSLYQAFAFLKGIAEQAGQVFILTHNFSFLKLALGWMRGQKSKSSYYMVKNDASKEGGRVARIAKLDETLENYDNEYQYLLALLRKFSNEENHDGTIESAHHIPNLARKVLETFLVFYRPHLSSRTTLREKVKALLGEKHFPFDKAKMYAMVDFFNELSHPTGDDTFDPSLTGEAQKNVGHLLEMIDHFTSPLTE